jgi:exopolysaccharide biosynthesis protein
LRATVLVFTLGAITPTSARAQAGDTTSARQLAPGVDYRQFTDRRGPWTMYLVRVDLRNADLELRAGRADARLKGRERVTGIVRREAATGVKVVAAVNADFFDLESGENENNQVVAGEWWKGLKVTDSPYDTWDNAHAQFAVGASHRVAMDRYQLDGRAWAHGKMTPVLTLNSNPAGKPEGTALYTARYGTTTPSDSTRPTVEAPLVAAGQRGDTALYVRRGSLSSTSATRIPSDGAVLSAYGAGLRRAEVKAMADGDTVKVLLSTLPHLPGDAAPSLVIGGWPRILHSGVDITADAPSVEGTLSRNAEMRHPRTAVGFSRDSSTLYLFAVDGRSENSGGMTLTELATTMRTLGAWDALNFDGGGSTTMVVGGVVVNKPSDPTGERAVGNALMVVVRP